MKEKLSELAKSVVLALSFIVGVVPGVAPVLASDLCGSTVITDLILDHDLTCTGNGLTVGADGIKINLNGHTITGPGSSIALVRGISLNQRNSVLHPGRHNQKFRVRRVRGELVRNNDQGNSLY